MAINGLSALPGVFFAPSSSLRVSAIFGVAVGVATIVLVLWPSGRSATVRP